MKLTRIHHCKNLNVQKYKQLEKQAVLLGRIRSEVWAKYGAISGLNISDRAIRDAWMKESRDFGVSANAWKETLRDCIGDIKAYREASKDKVKQAIRKRTSCNNEQKRLYTLLKKDEWMTDNFLHRQMRNHFKHGVNHTHNQIIVRADMCKTFELNGQCWLKVPSLIPRQTIKIPLNTTVDFAPQGTLRIILKNGNVEVHSTYDAVETQDCLLSCLCGSELVKPCFDALSKLLSCLCGSERQGFKIEAAEKLLSCLCGSELFSPKSPSAMSLLSCLCGSEP